MTINLLFVGQNFNFMQDIIDRFGRHPGYAVRTDKWQGHANHDEAASRELLNWADVIIANWLLGNAVWYSHHKRPGQLLIIRYHRFEITTDYPRQLNLANVDLIVNDSRIFQPKMEQLLSLPKEKSTFIYNPIVCADYERPKQPGSEYNLGLLGYNRKLKGLHRALDVWEKLAAADPRFKLYIKGSAPQETGWVWRDPQENAYFNAQYARIDRSPYKDRVIFEPFGQDVAQWLTKIGFICSMSDFESFHCACAEGMASGCLPLIAGWPGSETIYPAEFIYRDADRMAAAVRAAVADPAAAAAKRQQVMAYCRERFDIERIFDQFVQLIADMRGGKQR